jgi:hypothetical protein
MNSPMVGVHVMCKPDQQYRGECESPELLMTVSSASIPVLHSAEVVPCTPKSCMPCRQGLQGP